MLPEQIKLNDISKDRSLQQEVQAEKMACCYQANSHRLHSNCKERTFFLTLQRQLRADNFTRNNFMNQQWFLQKITESILWWFSKVQAKLIRHHSMKCSRHAMLVLVPKIETRKKKKPDKPNNSNLWTQHTKFFEHEKHLPNFLQMNVYSIVWY